MRRLRAVEIVAPGALSRLIAALDIPAERAARLRRDPRFLVFEEGGAAPRGVIAALRKRLIAAQFSTKISHRSAAYRAAWTATSQAMARAISLHQAIGTP